MGASITIAGMPGGEDVSALGINYDYYLRIDDSRRVPFTDWNDRKVLRRWLTLFNNSYSYEHPLSVGDPECNHCNFVDRPDISKGTRMPVRSFSDKFKAWTLCETHKTLDPQYYKSNSPEVWTGGGWVNEVSPDDIAATFKRDLTKAAESRKLDKSHGGYTVLVPCDKVPGGHHYQAVGIPDPAELICGHTFVNQKHSDGLVCTNPKCGLILSGTMLDALGPNRYDRERNRLADECGKLKSENDELLRENAMLRRRVEKFQR